MGEPPLALFPSEGLGLCAGTKPRSPAGNFQGASVDRKGPYPEAWPGSGFPRLDAEDGAADKEAMATPSQLNHLVIFARRPAIGVGKRRLAASVGDVEALRFQRSAIDGLLRRLAADPRWRTTVATAPDRPIDWLRGRAAAAAQGRGDLGRRLTRIARRFPTGRLVIIGSDTPTIGRADVAAAFDALRAHDAVVGPARDGGYWLIGLRRSARGPLPFDQVRWSSRHTLADTLARLAGLRTARLRTLEDVDDVASYRRFMARRQRP